MTPSLLQLTIRALISLHTISQPQSNVNHQY